MKKILLVALTLFLSGYCMAQDDLAFPFQGGRSVMTQFFHDNVVVGPEIVSQKATGTAVFKFTADDKGNISKIVIYYTDDLSLVKPIIAALQKSDHKWVIPDKEKFHDFLIPFSIRFNIPLTGNSAVAQAYYNFYLHHKPVPTVDQIPLNDATLLPTVEVNYDLK